MSLKAHPRLLLSAALLAGYLLRSFVEYPQHGQLQRTRTTLRHLRPAAACDAAQNSNQARLFDAARKANRYWSACPSASILLTMHAADPNPPQLTLVNIGANKGYAITDALALWRPDLGINPASWHGALVEQYPTSKDLCGACSDCKESTGPDRQPESAKPAVIVHAVEPLPTNVPLLKTLQARVHSGDKVSMFVHPGAVGPSADATLYFNASACNQVGRESCRLDIKGGPSMHQVTTWSLPSFVAEHRLDAIDLLIIDTEGYDGATLLHSVDFLEAHTARMIEFEYHGIGMWGPGRDKVQLKPVLDKLDAAGYACYLQGKDGTLVDLTGTCWSPAYEMFSWSNVLCTLRGDVWHAAAESLCAWKKD